MYPLNDYCNYNGFPKYILYQNVLIKVIYHPSQNQNSFRDVVGNFIRNVKCSFPVCPCCILVLG